MAFAPPAFVYAGYSTVYGVKSLLDAVFYYGTKSVFDVASLLTYVPSWVLNEALDSFSIPAQYRSQILYWHRRGRVPLLRNWLNKAKNYLYYSTPTPTSTPASTKQYGPKPKSYYNKTPYSPKTYYGPSSSSGGYRKPTYPSNQMSTSGKSYYRTKAAWEYGEPEYKPRWADYGSYNKYSKSRPYRRYKNYY